MTLFRPEDQRGDGSGDYLLGFFSESSLLVVAAGVARSLGINLKGAKGEVTIGKMLNIAQQTPYPDSVERLHEPRV